MELGLVSSETSASFDVTQSLAEENGQQGQPSWPMVCLGRTRLMVVERNLADGNSVGPGTAYEVDGSGDVAVKQDGGATRS